MDRGRTYAKKKEERKNMHIIGRGKSLEMQISFHKVFFLTYPKLKKVFH